MCGVLSEDATGGGRVLRDEEGMARALFSRLSDAKDADSAEVVAIFLVLDMVESLGWINGVLIFLEVGSNIVLNWLSHVELRPNKRQKLFQDIDSKSKKVCCLSYGKAEQKGNEMAFALAVVGVSSGEMFKAWW